MKQKLFCINNDDEDNLMVSVLVEKFAKDQKDIEWQKNNGFNQ